MQITAKNIRIEYLLFLLLTLFVDCNAQKVMSVKQVDDEFKKLKNDIKLIKNTINYPKRTTNNSILLQDNKYYICQKGKIVSYMGISLKNKFDEFPDEGSVLSINDLGEKNPFCVSNKANDNKVIGVLGVTFDKKNSNYFLATNGIIKVRVICEAGEQIEVGDLLISSKISGVATKTTNPEKSIGCIIGKALRKWDNDRKEGLIEVMLLLN